MARYLFVNKSKERKVMLQYNDNGLLCSMEIEGGMNGMQLDIFLSNVARHEGGLNNMAATLGGTISPVEEDLSFEAFWDRYDYKIGNKPRSRKLWGLLSDADKAQALRMIKPYDNWLIAKKTIEKLYPETYLSQRRFENSYRIG